MNIVIAIIILNLLIGVHELGHFLAAKFCKVGVEEFSLGMGPKIFSKKIKETTYSIRWVLLGGFVKLDEEGYINAKWFQQVLIIISGVLFNFIFAVIGVWIYIALSKTINVGFFTSIALGVQISVNMVVEIFRAVIDLFKTADTNAFAGPVGVVNAVSTYVEMGVIRTVEIFSVLNINLFVMNLLPIPMLDGGQIVLATIKKMFKKKEMPTFETIWNIVGLIVVGAIFVFALRNDALSFFK